MEHLKDGLPEVVRLKTNTNPVTLSIDTNGNVMACALDGMASFPVRDCNDILRVPREEQRTLLAQAYRDVLREIALMVGPPGPREMQRMACLAVGLGWREPEGHAKAGYSMCLSGEEAIRYLVGQWDRKRREGKL